MSEFNVYPKVVMAAMRTAEANGTPFPACDYDLELQAVVPLDGDVEQYTEAVALIQAELDAQSALNTLDDAIKTKLSRALSLSDEESDRLGSLIFRQ